MRPLLAALLCASCVPAAPDGRGSQSIVGGVDDVSHPSVVAIVGRRPTCESDDRVHCSGTLIAPRVVLTAAHCLDRGPPEELEVIVGADVTQPERILAVWQAYVHPAYDDSGEPEVSNDLALLVLESDAGPSPATLPTAALAELAVDAEVEMVAFGRTSEQAASGRRLAAASRIDSLTSLAIVTDDTGVPCGGDSGGAVFVATPGGPVLAAVIKASGAACTAPGVSIRVDAVVDDFIAPTLLAANAVTSSGRPPLEPAAPFCAETCAAHEECPLGMLCLPERDGMHCGYRVGRVGTYGDVCVAADGESCVPVGQGSERACRLRSSCEVGDGGGFCQAGRDGSGAGWLALVILLGLRPRRSR